jgi:carotenoid cleavage dioxygenase-like enzyme
MTTKIYSKRDITSTPSNHPYMVGPWAPTDTEFTVTDPEVIGEIPKDLDGVYLRNGQNPATKPMDRYHLFDGDGMLHGMSFRDGRAEYRNRWVRTKGFLAEQQEGRALWSGLIDPPEMSERPGWGAHGALKDTSCTDVVLHAGKAMSTWYQCGDAYRLDARTLEQYGADDFGGKFPEAGISAHSHVDEVTGDFLFFNYDVKPPYMNYGVIDKNNKIAHYVPIDLPGARLPHDMAFTENYTILMDLPLFWDAELLEKNVHRVKYHRDVPSRFGIIPRFGNSEDIRWFETDPSYIYHTLNAYEEGDWIILDAAIVDHPEPATPAWAYPFGKIRRGLAYTDPFAMGMHPYRWRFNMKTGETKHESIDDLCAEFPMGNFSVAGRKMRYGYYSLMNWGILGMTGLVKYDFDTGKREVFNYGNGRIGSEAPFAPKIGAKDEDDGYIVSYITDMIEKRSECAIFDAKDIAKGPVAQVLLPKQIAGSSHSYWARGDQIVSDWKSSAA